MPKYDRLEHDGIKFDCRPGTSDEKSFKEVIVRRGYRRRNFEPAADQVWLDLGVNVGAFMVWAGHLGARVVGYEADPDSAEMAEHNLKINGLLDDVKLIQKAVVTDDRKTVTLHRNDARGNVWRNSIERTWQGGSDIKVPAVHISKCWKPGRWVKMDIEGTEMPVLEDYGLTHKVQGLVFEWSFDVDPDLNRFRAAIAALREQYDNVLPATADNLEGDTWRAEWFPPCKTIWCFDNPKN